LNLGILSSLDQAHKLPTLPWPNILSKFVRISAQALSGVFLAEQIRQQQLAAALESRLDSQSFSAMQAAMLLNKLKAGAETSKLLAAASTPSTVSVLRNERPKGRGTKQNKVKSVIFLLILKETNFDIIKVVNF